MSGRAVSNASPITADITPLVYQEIEQRIMSVYPNIQMCPLGSIGKKRSDQTNGDIDIAIVIDNQTQLNSLLKEIFPECELNDHTVPGTTSSIGYKYSLGVAQADFMVTHDIEWAAWRWSSPDFRKNESNYKGQAKDWVMRCITHALPSNKDIDYFEDGQVMRCERVIFNFGGLWKRRMNFIGKRGQHINRPTIEEEELISNNPLAVMQYVLGKDAVEDDFVKGAEWLWDKAHQVWPWGDELLQKFEEDFYTKYVMDEKRQKEIVLNPKDFPRKF